MLTRALVPQKRVQVTPRVNRRGAVTSVPVTVVMLETNAMTCVTSTHVTGTAPVLEMPLLHMDTGVSVGHPWSVVSIVNRRHSSHVQPTGGVTPCVVHVSVM